MSKSKKILFSVNTKSHTNLILDEIDGIKDLGFECERFDYGSKNDNNSNFSRFRLIVFNALKLVIKSYKFKPNYVYFNSRVEYIASTRDFITLIIFKSLYYRKVRLIIKSHGSDLEILSDKNKLYKNIIVPFLKAQVDGWLFLSKEEISFIATNGLLERKRVFLTKNIVREVDLELITKRKKNTEDPEKSFVFLFVGRLIKEKGVYHALEAFAEIEKNCKAALTIIGDGEEMTEVKAKIKSLNLQDKVFLTGWISETQVLSYTLESDVLVLPTYCSEGFSMALFNSVAAGLAIITTPVRAAVDYLQEPENCLWVEKENSSSIVLAMGRLISDPVLRNKMRANNKAKAKLFEKKVVAEELSNIFENISV